MNDPRASEPMHPNASPARRGAMIAILSGMALLVGSALSGCQGTTDDTPAAAGGHASAPTSAGQVALAVPVELRQVLGSSPCTPQTASPTTTSAIATSPGTPITLHDVDDVDCYQVSGPLMELQQLDAISVASQPPASQWVITMTLTPSDAQSFAALTAQHDQQELAYVVRGTVLSTQTLTQPITSGTVQLEDNFTQDDANRLVRQITS